MLHFVTVFLKDKRTMSNIFLKFLDNSNTPTVNEFFLSSI
ncbi:hypothetical protein JOD18_003678 [Gracilibacillus alcaliphilus]|nr:hypothetical protein [Gracilibacillus alcaliphilus]